MIDIWEVVANGVWIVGLAVLLAAFSWASWVASVEGGRFRTVLGRPGVQRALGLGLVLFCVGLAATGRTCGERALWGGLSVLFAVKAWLVGRPGETMGGGRDGD